MGEEKINQGRRKFIYTASCLSVGIALPGIVSASNYKFDKSKIVKYKPTKPLSEDQIKEIIENSKGNCSTFKYYVPTNNKHIEGGLIIKIMQESAEVLIRFKQGYQDRLIIFSERKEGEKTFYSEYEYDYKTKQKNYDEKNKEVGVMTIPGLIKNFFNGGGDNKEFSFWGKDGSEKIFTLKSSKEETKDKRRADVGKIESCSSELYNPKAKQVEVLFNNFNGVILPEKIDIDYQIDDIPVYFLGIYLGKTSKDITFRGSLTDKIENEEELFKRPNA